MTGHEDRLRELLQSQPAPSSALDVERIVARARRRRLPRQLAAGGVSALAASGVLVLALQSLPVGDDASMVATDLGSTMNAPEVDSRGTCAIVDEASQPTAPLELSSELDATTREVTGRITLLNTTDDVVTGRMDSSTVVLEDDHGALWEASAHVPVEFALGPGDSTSIPLRLAPTPCDGVSTRASDLEVRSVNVYVEVGQGRATGHILWDVLSNSGR